MKNKYGRDLSTPLAPTYGGPGPITKKMADKVTKIASESNTKLKKQNKAAKKNRIKNAALKAATGLAIAGKVVYDAYHRNIQNDYTAAYMNAGGSENTPYGDSPTNKQLRKWKKGKK